MEKHEEISSNSLSPPTVIDDWASFRDDDIMHQHYAIRAEQADKIHFLGDKVFFSSSFTITLSFL